MKHIRLIIMFALGALFAVGLLWKRKRGTQAASQSGVVITAKQYAEHKQLKARREGLLGFLQESSDRMDAAPSPSDGEREHVKGIEALADELASKDPDEHSPAFFRQYYYRQQAKHRYMTNLFQSDRDARRVKRLQGGN